MKIYEIVKGMMEEKYINGDKFMNSSLGGIFIYCDELLWEGDITPYEIFISDDSEWEKV